MVETPCLYFHEMDTGFSSKFYIVPTPNREWRTVEVNHEIWHWLHDTVPADNWSYNYDGSNRVQVSPELLSLIILKFS